MSLLDQPETLRRIDRFDMLSKVSAFPEAAREGWNLGLSFAVPKGFQRSNRFLFLGMGGSGIGGDILKGILQGRRLPPIEVSRSYTIPGWVDSQTLVVAISYSGNTEETLAAVNQAKRRKAQILAIASGGKLAAWAKNLGVAFLRIPSGWPPRSALGYLTFVPLGVLMRLKERARFPLAAEDSFKELKAFIHQRLEPSVGSLRNPAKQIALFLKGCLPILYGASDGWEGVTYRWRTQLEENAKTLAFHHLFPEATHNEISGWVHPKALLKETATLFLADPEVHPRVKRRMEFFQRIVRAQGARVLTVQVPGNSRLTRTLRLIALGDFASVYLGLLYRVDPTPVERVEALKRYMVRAR